MEAYCPTMLPWTAPEANRHPSSALAEFPRRFADIGLRRNRAGKLTRDTPRYSRSVGPSPFADGCFLFRGGPRHHGQAKAESPPARKRSSQEGQERSPASLAERHGPGDPGGRDPGAALAGGPRVRDLLARGRRAHLARPGTAQPGGPGRPPRGLVPLPRPGARRAGARARPGRAGLADAPGRPLPPHRHRHRRLRRPDRGGGRRSRTWRSPASSRLPFPAGGVAGAGLARFSSRFLSTWGSAIALSAIAVIALIVATGAPGLDGG